MSKRQKKLKVKNPNAGSTHAFAGCLKFLWDLVIGVWSFAGTAMHE
jgi:hypothetical protein